MDRLCFLSCLDSLYEFPCLLCQSVLQGSTVVPVRALCLPLFVCCAGLDPRVWHMLSPASQPLSVPFLSLPFPLALLSLALSSSQ